MGPDRENLNLDDETIGITHTAPIEKKLYGAMEAM